MAQKTWAVGEEVLAADFNTYVQNQVIPAFTNAAQRDSQWTSPPNGARCITVDSDTEWSRVNGVWTVARGQHMVIAQVTANQASISTTSVDLTGLTVTFTAAGVARRYLLHAFVQLLGTANADAGRVDICQSDNTVLQTAQAWLSGSYGVSVYGMVVVSPGAGAVSYKLRAVKTFGGGTMTMVASAVTPAILEVVAL